MKDILTAPFLVEMVRTAANMYAHGWDERNGGNVSLLLEEEKIDLIVLAGFMCILTKSFSDRFKDRMQPADTLKGITDKLRLILQLGLHVHMLKNAAAALPEHRAYWCNPAGC